MRGNFARPTIQKGMEKRRVAMQNPLWPIAMATVLRYKEHSGFFRWYASGDVQSLGDLLAICQVARLTPHITHWLPTHEVGILSAFKRAGFKYPRNLVVRLSGDMIDSEPPKRLLKSLGVLGAAVKRTNYDCPARSQEGSCLQCRRCWDKDIPMINFPLH